MKNPLNRISTTPEDYDDNDEGTEQEARSSEEDNIPEVWHFDPGICG